MFYVLQLVNPIYKKKTINHDYEKTRVLDVVPFDTAKKPITFGREFHVAM